MNKQFVSIVSIYRDGDIANHPFYNYSDAQDKFILCIKESKHEISEDKIEKAVMLEYYFDSYEETVITICQKKII